MKFHFSTSFQRVALQCCLLILLITLPLHGMSGHRPNAEYKLKAALLYKLTKFVEWPETDSDASDWPFGLCVLGKDHFGTALNALEQRKVAGRAIVIRRLDQSEAVRGHCDLVFISDSKRAFLRPILQGLREMPILSVGDVEGFAEQGGIIQFTAGKRIGFKINIERARLSGLKIAAPLLQLATIVNSTD